MKPRFLGRSRGLQQDHGGALRLGGERRDSIACAALALCTLETPQQPSAWAGLVDARPGRRAYQFDLLAKSFVHGYRMAPRYKPDRFQAPWTDPLLRAPALPAGARAHMKNWCDCGELLSALYENGHAIPADIKDDDTLAALAAWVTPRGYRLFRIASDSGDWNAVLVRAGYADEFLALRDSLRIRFEAGEDPSRTEV